ncbi:MAG: hypothetical protein WAL32_18415, partial [Terriglobales bacterium]
MSRFKLTILLPGMLMLGWILPRSHAQNGLVAVNVPGATETDCNAINKSGVVVGYYVDIHGTNHGFALIRGSFRFLDVPGAQGTFPYGINDQDQAVGWYTDSDFIEHGFLYSGGKITTLDPPGSVLTNAWSINNSGTVVGTFEDGSGL